MEPCSILELSSTVLKLSLKLYRFFKALHDAPEEVHEYLSVLESIRRVFQDVKEYAEAHLHSAFFEHDGMRLTVVEAALQDCELEFTLQLSNVEELDPATASSFFRAMGRQTKWVLRKETLEGLTKKLEKLQGLLSLAVMTSTGRNEVFMREKLQSISFDVGKVHAAQEAERVEREEFISTIQQFTTAFQKRTAGFIKLAAELHIRGDARLSDICESLDTEFGTKGESEVRTSKPAASVSSLENSVDGLANEHEASALSAGQESGDTSSTLRDQSDEETSYFRSNSVEVDVGVRRTTHQNQVDHFEKTGASEIFDRAVRAYRNVSPQADDFLKLGSDRKAQDAVRAVLMQTKDPVRSRISKILNIVNVFVQQNTASTAVLLGAMRLLIASSNPGETTLSVVTDSLQEMSEVVRVCERELVLYQDPEIIRLLEQCYVELLQFLERCHRAFPKLKSSTAELLGLQIPFRTSMEKSMAQIRKLSQSVLREVDYRHRLEMRDASHRLVEMQTEQRKILLAVEDQKRVLQALQEERSIMSLVQEQQKIMQVVQNIQRRMQNSTLQDAGSRVDV